MDNAEVFWSEVQEAVSELVATVSKQRLQPNDGVQRDRNNKWPKTGGAIYMTSIKNRAAKEHKPGAVTLMPYFLAAQRVVEGMYAVSTDEEIRAYEKEQAAKRDLIQTGAARNRGVAQFTVPPINDGGSK